MNKINAICFDMWGTLCEGGGDPQWKDLYQILDPKQTVDDQIFFKQVEISLLTNPWSLKEGIKNISQKLKLVYTEGQINKGYKSWWSYVEKSKPYPEVQDVLAKLEKLKISKFLISNTDVEAFNFKIKKLDWKKYFDKFFLSGEIGVLKPNVKIFQTVQNYLSIPKNKILMIDDSLYHGIIPARNFGWKSLWLARRKKFDVRQNNRFKINDLNGIFQYL